ncbi:hypothetical protein ACFE04_010309 [Oxalis oulophora]
MKRRLLIITDFAIYVIDPDTNALKRRIAIAAVDKMCLSELSDNFFAIIIPTEYDLLMASTRKTEIVTVFVVALSSLLMDLESWAHIWDHTIQGHIFVSTAAAVLSGLSVHQFTPDKQQMFFLFSFEYHAAAELVKEVQFEEVEGGVTTRILSKGNTE